MRRLKPICFRRGWLGRPLYKPVLPAEAIVPRISWDTSPHDPYQAGCDQIIETHTHLLCWKEVNGIYRYGAWGKDLDNRPGSGPLESPRFRVRAPAGPQPDRDRGRKRRWLCRQG